MARKRKTLSRADYSYHIGDALRYTRSAADEIDTIEHFPAADAHLQSILYRLDLARWAIHQLVKREYVNA